MLRFLPAILTILLAWPPLFAQDHELFYQHDNFDMRNLVLLPNEYKLAVEVKHPDQPLRLFLMNAQNLIVDTLPGGSYCYTYHPLPGKRIVGEGHRSTQVLSFADNRLRLLQNYRYCSDSQPGYMVFFNNRIYSFYQINGKSTHYKLIELNPAPDGCLDTGRGKVIFEKEGKPLIKKGLAITLPVTFGLTATSLRVFIRDLQLLIEIIPGNRIQQFVPDSTPGWSWNYFYDAAREEDYFLKFSNKQLLLFKKSGRNLHFVTALQHIPEQIFDRYLIYCEGDSDRDCRFFTEKLHY